MLGQAVTGHAVRVGAGSYRSRSTEVRPQALRQRCVSVCTEKKKEKTDSIACHCAQKKKKKQTALQWGIRTQHRHSEHQ